MIERACPVPADAELAIEGYFDKSRLHRNRGAVRRVPSAITVRPHVDPVFRRHRDHHAQGRAAPDRAARRGQDRAHRARAQQCAILTEAQIRQVLAAPESIPWSPSMGAERQRLAARAGVGAARASRAGARRDHGAVRCSVPQAHLCAGRGGRRIRRRGGGVGVRQCFRADRDLVTAAGQMAFPMDVTAGEDRTTTKAGFDLTGPLAKAGVEARTAHAPRIDGAPRYQTVEQALGARPMIFTELMACLGSRDGREIALELDRLRGRGALARTPEGEWMLKT